MTSLLALLLTPSIEVPSQSTQSIDPTFFSTRAPRIGLSQKLAPDAAWIWTKKVSDHQEVSLTKEFVVRESVKTAKIYLTVDNFFTLSLDGTTLGGTKAGVDDVDGWRTAKTFDLSGKLNPGKHEVRIDAVNAAGEAGALFRLEINGKPVVLSDSSWKAIDVSSHGTQEAATVEAKGGAGPWGGDLSGWPVEFDALPSYLAHLPIRPVRICIDGNFADPDNLNWQPATSHLDLKSPTPGKPWSVLLDFGKELSGRVVLEGKMPGPVTIGTGESSGEAIEKPYTFSTVDLGSMSKGSSRYSAFRYAMLGFSGSDAHGSLEANLDHLYYPVVYRGSFDCSDPLLNQIWYTGAYTAHLCMQQDIWDAPKRDRARWMGDLHVSGEVINNVFLDKFLMEQTMRRLRDDAQGNNPPDHLPQGHVNGIPGYSCAWLAGMADFYKHTGELGFVKGEQSRIVSMMEYFKGELGPDGTFENNHKSWPFVDWSPEFDKDSPQSRATTHLFLVKALEDGAFLLKACGDQGSADKYLKWAEQLKEVAREKLANKEGTYGSRRQENSMAVYSGVATGAQRAAIFQKVLNPEAKSWKEVTSPYYNNYVIFALSDLGKTQQAMDYLRSFWGGMIQGGATTFWEGYDSSWSTHNSHSHLQADDGTGYFVSLCHGWSAGPTNWLTEEVVGVKPLDGGFRECQIKPDLGDLSFVKGTVPTPHGAIKVSVTKTGPSCTMDLVIPSDVKIAHVLLKGYVLSGPSLKVAPGTTRELILGPGHYNLTGK